ncbi:homoserine dehydrogenase [Clostridium cellulovorans]|uniref:Homoserine dehydrogenase n=1 Tax=Clostridium cellulovorans (strain ATCC 35296 / DSM 3052 / OCM 3 / 743B) TaxID=573061 RepID=D9SSQ8_CLOC7|nr:homoserine dehydrogenase [Clostridium cellulovorans]ADL52570.1 homoserine dehydrogenase [Clostridium cellulovorans 743B]
MEKVKIALLGFGNVGQGVWKILNTNKREIMINCGYEVEVGKILVRDKNKPRAVEVPDSIVTTDINDILSDKDIKIVVELMGGSEPSKEYILSSLKAKKHVVTANKLLLATVGDELISTADAEGVQFYYEASVGGGIPVIREINESLTANKIESIVGIINGTTNYILTKMSQESMGFEEALKEAQAKGYAEADPTSDVEAYDSVYKLAIMASLAFSTKVDSSSIYREGICKIDSIDIDYAKKFGYVIKLLAIGKEIDNELELRVHPTMISKNHPIANINDSFNAIFIKGNAVGDLLLSGRGAGDLPTGSAVVGDIISIIRNKADLRSIGEIKSNLPLKKVKDFNEATSRYYIRLQVADIAGVLGEIAAVFGQYDVSILSVNQEVIDKDSVSLVFITHSAKEGNVSNSMKVIESLDHVNQIASIIRIEEF